MNKIINIENLKIICGVAVIILIIAIPFMVENIDEDRMVEKSYKTKKIEFTLDSDVEDIEMVKRIHSTLNSVYNDSNRFYVSDINNVLISDNTDFDTSLVTKQVNEMNSKQGFNNIFDKFISNDRSKIFNENYFTQVGDIVFANYVISKESSADEDYSEEEMSFIYDKQQDKILGFSVKTENISEISEEKKIQLLETMVDYLNIKIVEDWMYDGYTLVSNKAHLRLRCESGKDIITVSVNTDNGYFIY